MNEASLWTDRIRPRLAQACVDKGWHAHFERVENAVGTGTPDVDYCIHGVAGKIELKYATKHPARAATPVLGRERGLRRSQVIWVHRRLRAGGRVFVAIGTPEETWFVNLRGWTREGIAGLALVNVARLREISAWCSFSHGWGTLPLTLVA